MKAKIKALELVGEFYAEGIKGSTQGAMLIPKKCALISIKNEYSSLREQLFNLRACGVIENEKTYLFRLEELIDNEQEVKDEIEKL